METRLSKILYAAVFLSLLFIGNVRLFAESPVSSLPFQDRVARWKELKEKNPEEFERRVQERKQQIRERVQKMKQNDPQKFEDFKEKFSERRREKAENLKRENPEQFKQEMRQRMQKLMQNHPQMAERMQQRQRERSGKFQRQDRQQNI